MSWNSCSGLGLRAGQPAACGKDAANRDQAAIFGPDRGRGTRARGAHRCASSCVVDPATGFRRGRSRCRRGGLGRRAPPNPPVDVEAGEAAVANDRRQLRHRRREGRAPADRNNRRFPFFTEALAPGVALDMAAIPAGEFIMGAPRYEPERRANEGPEHTVTMRSFFIGAWPITQAQWGCGRDPPSASSVEGAKPVPFVLQGR